MASYPESLSSATSIVAGLSDATILLDVDLRAVAYNAAYAQLCGVRRRNIEKHFAAGGSPFELIGGSLEEDLARARACLAEKRVVRVDEVALKNAQGDEITTIVSFIPVVDAAEKAIGLLHSIRDVSAEARMQTRYQELVAIEKARGDELERQVQERTRELREALAEVTRLSRHDALTGVLNRRAFAELAESAVALAMRHGRHAALIMFDLDHFKRLNDTYGHQAGDKVLFEAANAIAAALRRTDKLARFGGEEFVALLPETDPGSVFMVADRCREAVRDLDLKKLVNDPTAARQTVSVGVAVFPQHGTAVDTLVSAADKALYHAKQTGRDRVVIFNDDVGSTTKPWGSRSPAVLLAHRSSEVLEHLAPAIRKQGYAVQTVTSLEAARVACTEITPIAILVGEALSDGPGVALLHECYNSLPEAGRLLLYAGNEPPSLRGAAAALIDRVIGEQVAPAQIIEQLEEVRLQHDVKRRAPARPFDADILAGLVHLQVGDIIAQRALDFVFQPIVDAASRAIIGYEALCRPRTDAVREPRPLVEAAVHCERMWELGRFLRGMLADCLPEMPEGAKLFINLHPTELEDPQLLVGEGRLFAWRERIVFEIDERATVPEFDRCRERLDQLRAKGAHFAIGPIGSSHGDLQILAQTRPDFFKIGMQLVRGVDAQSTQAELVRRAIVTAHENHIRVVGEGVETAAEAKALIDLGCDCLQGLFFYEPKSTFVAKG
jgi:diguanylate cyclase (GGDEF)-like protein